MNFASHPYLFLCCSLMIVGEWYAASLAIQCCRKSYPWFTTLLCVMAVKSLLLFYLKLNLHPVAYFYAYYQSGLLFSFFQLGSTIEVFGVLFRPFWTVPRKSLVTLTLCTSVVLAVVAHANAVLPIFTNKGEGAFYQSMDRVVSCTSGLVLSSVLLFAQYFEMPYRSRLKGIASGLFLMAVSSVITAFLIANLARHSIIMLSFVPMCTHYVSLTFWCYAMQRKEALVANVGRNELEALYTTAARFKLALGNTPTSCGLTARKGMGKATGEQKAKTVNNNG